MRLNDCVNRFSSTGCCGIDRDIALKTFTKRCLISKYYNEYRLVRITHKRNYSMKITIEQEDAEFLINELGLVEYNSAIFNNGSTFLMKGANPLRI